MAEFLIQTDLTPIKSWTLEANFKEMGEELNEMMEPYKKLVVTEDTVSDAKADLAKIRKVGKNIDEVRKAVKKIWTEPLKVFEDKCKGLSSICDEVCNNLDGQVKRFEQEEKNNKIDALKAYYNASVSDMATYLSFDVIFNPRWGNKGFSLEEAKEEIMTDILKCRQEVDTIRSVAGVYETALLTEYARTHNLNGALRLKSVMEERERIERERKSDVHKNQKKVTEPDSESHADGMIEISFKVRVTKEQMEGLKQYMKENGIKPERV